MPVAKEGLGMSYPATFDVQPPKEFDKAQIALRILIIIFLGWLVDAVLGFAYLALPVVAAVLISQKGAEQYHAEAETGPTKWLRYIMGFLSYIALTTDELPLDRPEQVNLKVQPTGSPTVGSALLRLILGIPHALVLGILGIVFGIMWLISVVSILLNGTQPDWASNFMRGYLRWTARFLAYMASLVDEYPPFSFENGEALAPAGQAPPAEPAPSEPPPTEPSGGDTSPPAETR
jgi:hypothetical protein